MTARTRILEPRAVRPGFNGAAITDEVDSEPVVNGVVAS